ncbi:hypothetical protein NM688_g723 [Phlebia brevispora]|uniref:Uncharacterized protein n=1 Tax=Phlebia brevispora TaxID=194682 RepID=A0ACC1TDB6_9APHY|nr:hypothetical protein NM688_g723 [Phlebia brevispora]
MGPPEHGTTATVHTTQDTTLDRSLSLKSSAPFYTRDVIAPGHCKSPSQISQQPSTPANEAYSPFVQTVPHSPAA